MTTEEAQDRAAFQRQTGVDRVVTIALNAIDKPGAEGLMNLGGGEAILAKAVQADREIVEEALTRVRELAAQNPRDFVAAGAVQLLTNALA